MLLVSVRVHHCRSCWNGGLRRWDALFLLIGKALWDQLKTSDCWGDLTWSTPSLSSHLIKSSLSTTLRFAHIPVLPEYLRHLSGFIARFTIYMTDSIIFQPHHFFFHLQHFCSPPQPNSIALFRWFITFYRLKHTHHHNLLLAHNPTIKLLSSKNQPSIDHSSTSPQDESSLSRSGACQSWPPQTYKPIHL